MLEPLVSVIIPVYNGANYLKEAIESVLAQTYKSIELIVVNDGSDDGGETEQIALEYGTRIHYIKKENGGVATALNRGIQVMKGEYFAWLSHDDIFYPDKIKTQIQIIKEKRVLITACAYDIFMDGGRKIPVPIVQFYGKDNLEKSVFSVLNAMIQFGGVLMHKSIFEKYGMFQEELKTTQDYEFLFRVLRKEKCSYSNECLYGIRYHENQGSNTISSVPIERDEMYVTFLEKLTEEEKKYIYGSLYNFYYQMLLRIIPISGMERSYKMCIEGLKQASQETIQKERESQNVTNNKIWIYGAGNYGRRLLFDLRCRDITVEGFIDKNQRLHGKAIDGIVCMNLEEMKKNTQGKVVIASLYREEIAQQLKEKGLYRFEYKEEFEKNMIQTPPPKNRVLEYIKQYEKNGWRW